MKEINHIADFSSLGGVQTYIYSLYNRFPNDYKIYTVNSNVLDIYKRRTKNDDYVNIFSLRFLFSKNKQIFIIHNLILSKKWIFIFIILKLKNCEIIYHEHGTAWSNPKKNRKLFAKRISNFDKIIVNSRATKNLLENFYKVDKKLAIFRSPVFIYEELFENKNKDLNLKFKKSKKDRYKLNLGYIGRLALHKNPFFLVEVALILKEKYHKKRVVLNFVGSGPLRKNLEKICKKKNIESRFFGRVENRRQALAEWKYCIVPSVREPLGLVPGEMALLDKIAFSSCVDGLPEMYPSNCNYLLINMAKSKNKNENIQYLPEFNEFRKNYYPDVYQCVDKIIKLENDNSLYKKLLKNHKKYIKYYFDISRHSEDLKYFIFN